MASLSSFQIYPPSNWQDFERLCCDLYSSIVHSESVQINGTPGQEQNGVDIFFQDFEKNLRVGIQCKGRDGRYGHAISSKELMAAVDEAKKFPAELGKFILMTSGKTDNKIQELARTISELHREIGLFEVEVWSWDNIVLLLDRYPEVARRRLQLNVEFFQEIQNEDIGKKNNRYDVLVIQRRIIGEFAATTASRVHNLAILLSIMGFSLWIGVIVCGIKGIEISGGFRFFPFYVFVAIFSMAFAVRMHGLKKTGVSYTIPPFRKVFFEINSNRMYLSKFDAACPQCGADMKLTIVGEWGKQMEEHFVCMKNQRQHSINMDMTYLPPLPTLDS